MMAPKKVMRPPTNILKRPELCGSLKNLFPLPLKILKEIPEGEQMTYHIKDVRGRLHWATLMKEQGEWKVDEFSTITVED